MSHGKHIRYKKMPLTTEHSGFMGMPNWFTWLTC